MSILLGGQYYVPMSMRIALLTVLECFWRSGVFTGFLLGCDWPFFFVPNDILGDRSVLEMFKNTYVLGKHFGRQVVRLQKSRSSSGLFQMSVSV
jgi:hypothetical protein